jgi:hypothetical protein
MLTKDMDPFMRVHLHDLITSQSPHLQIPSHWGIKASVYECRGWRWNQDRGNLISVSLSWPEKGVKDLYCSKSGRNKKSYMKISILYLS